MLYLRNPDDGHIQSNTNRHNLLKHLTVFHTIVLVRRDVLIMRIQSCTQENIHSLGILLTYVCQQFLMMSAYNIQEP